MRRADRLFEIIQMLRTAHGPLTAAAIGEALEVTPRTIYRDNAVLQAMRVPIEGAAGIGYLLRAGYDLPPLNFTVEEIEAIVVGLSLLARTGDAGLMRAAATAAGKIAVVTPGPGGPLEAAGLHVSGWGVEMLDAVDPGMLRSAIRNACKLRLHYSDHEGEETARTVLPVALIYYVESVVLAAWCELRQDFRHFRADRMLSCEPLEERFMERATKLRAAWETDQARAE
ncbi:MAG: YafY family transcriptional regulator [Alphaproteobacteria bacterium]|nr:YafY family transcriptional regulator [Alphaproteobacteria bacterium]